MPKKVPIKIRSLSGFDKSYQNIFTSKPGTIVPILVDEVIPSTKIHLKTAIQASLPPLAFDTFMRVSLKVQAFFVPFRLLVGSFEDYFTGSVQTVNGTTYNPAMPYAYIDSSHYSDFENSEWLKANQSSGTALDDSANLSDFLGIRGAVFPTGAGVMPPAGFRFSLLPYLAYHRVYDDWFRNTLVQRPLFERPDTSSFAQVAVKNMPYLYLNSSNCAYELDDGTNGYEWSDPVYALADGVSLFSLRQANFPDDLFTLSQPSGSQAASTVTVSSNQFTIPAVRMANAMQRYAEVKQIVGPRYLDELNAQYGAHLSSGVAQRVLYLGSAEFEVYSKGIYQTNDNANSALYTNPFSATGARYGDAIASGSGLLVSDFTAEEPGYLMVMAELVPRVTYATGFAPHMTRYCSGTAAGIGDMANPIFEGVGNEAIPTNFMQPVIQAGQPSIFGYGDRFVSWKTRLDELHGLVRDGESLEAMVLQRSFGNGNYGINSAWLQIPTTYLDQITAVSADVSKYGYWCDAYFDYKVSMPLKPYALPCLEEVDEEHQRTTMVDMSGSRV